MRPIQVSLQSYTKSNIMFNASGWSYATSSGIGITAGEEAEITIQQTRLYLTSPNGDTYKVIATGAGGGIGASAIPASITGSTTDFVSAGTNVYSLYNETITIDDLSGMLVIYSGNLTWLTGEASGSLVIFCHGGAGQFALAAIPLVGPMVAFAKVVKGFCLIGSGQLSTPNLGADATGTFYWVSSADTVAAP
jgi:hypothetical protein